jgi:hypothetical protein
MVRGEAPKAHIERWQDQTNPTDLGFPYQGRSRYCQIIMIFTMYKRAVWTKSRSPLKEPKKKFRNTNVWQMTTRSKENLALKIRLAEQIERLVQHHNFS